MRRNIYLRDFEEGGG